MGIGIKLWIEQVRNTGFADIELDKCCAFDFRGNLTSLPLVVLQEGV
jgi:hypothetical protein